MKIKRKLLFEVLLSYTLLILLLGGGILAAALIRFHWDGCRIQAERDVEFAMHIGDFVRLYYRRQNNLDGLGKGIDLLFLQRGKFREHREDWVGKSPDIYTPPRILITNPEKKEILYSTVNSDVSFDLLDREIEGIRVSVNNIVLAYVYVGTMIPGEDYYLYFSPEIKKTMALLCLYSVLLILFSIGLGFFFAFRIAGPINELNNAFKQVSRNQFSVRLKTGSNNEIGYLLNSFNMMVQKLEESDNARRQMSADISHDFRTPLTLIRGRLEMIKAGVYPPDQTNFDYILKEIEHMSHMLDEWRELSRLEAGSLESSGIRIELNSFLETLLGSFSPLKEEHNMIFDFVPSPEPLYIIGDGDNLSRAFGNLIVNAVKFSKPGGLIRLSLRREGNEALINVYDNGIGIPSDKIKYIFDRLYKVDSSRGQSHSGSGLGLPICKSIINAHVGTITASSVEGESTVFFIRIPLA